MFILNEQKIDMWNRRTVFFLKTSYLFEGVGQHERGKSRERRTSRNCTKHRVRCGTWSYNPEIITRAEIKSWTPNRLSHLGTPGQYYSQTPKLLSGCCRKERVNPARTLDHIYLVQCCIPEFHHIPWGLEFSQYYPFLVTFLQLF